MFSIYREIFHVCNKHPHAIHEVTRLGLKMLECFFNVLKQSSYPCPGVVWFWEASAKEAVNTLVSESCWKKKGK